MIAGIADGCKQAGCALIGGETAEMPGMYAGKDYDLAGFAVGAVERGEILPRADVVRGRRADRAAIVGRALQRLLPGAPAGRAKRSWAGTRRRRSTLPRRWREALLVPTRIYVKPVLKAVRETGGIKALAHITGGGLSENLPRVLPDGIAAHVDLGAWKAPAVFGWLQQAGRLDDAEMLRTFNCGIGMILVVAKDAADAVVEAARSGRRKPRPHRRDRARPRRQIASQRQG